MLNAINVRTAKRAAKTLASLFEEKGVKVPHGRALDMTARLCGVRDWNALVAQLNAQTDVLAKPTPAVRDILFDEVTNLVLNGQPFAVRWREEQVLTWLKTHTDLPSEDDDTTEVNAYDTALHLGYEEDGLIFEETVTLEELHALQWDSAKQCFVGPDGDTWRFFVENEFGVAPSQAATASGSESASRVVDPSSSAPAPQARASDKAPQLYLVKASLKDSTSALHALRERVVAASSISDAKARATMAFPVEESAELEIRQIDDALVGPFSVFVDGGFYDRSDSFSKAWHIAKFLAEEVSQEGDSHIRAADGSVVFTFGS